MLQEPFTAELIEKLLKLRDQYESDRYQDLVVAVDGTIERLRDRCGSPVTCKRVE